MKNFMYLSKIELLHFRNYNKINLKLCNKCNIFLGNNGVGKTNILESIYILALTKSYKIGLENNIINKNSESCKISGILNDSDIFKELEIIVSNDKKIVKCNKKEVKKLSSYISNMNVIMFSPTDLDIIKGSPQIRRNLLNVNISQLYPLYLNYLNEYNKLLKNRNEYLKKLNINGYTDYRYLEIIDDKLADRGCLIMKYRKDYIEFINNHIEKVFNNIIGKNNLSVIYESSIEFNDDFDTNKKIFISKLKKNIKKDIVNGMTSYGIHRDDFSFYFKEDNLKYFSSQGQQRVVIISFKLCEIMLFKEKINKCPILLLDDIFSELDIKTRNNLIKYIPDDIQTIITTTDLKNIKKSLLNKSKIFIIENNKVKEKDG